MPAPKGKRDATLIRSIARTVQDHLYAKGTEFNMQWMWDRLREIENIATDMNASTGTRDPRVRKRKPAAKKSARKRR
jgi:hypothetical protein